MNLARRLGAGQKEHKLLGVEHDCLGQPHSAVHQHVMIARIHRVPLRIVRPEVEDKTGAKDEPFGNKIHQEVTGKDNAADCLDIFDVDFHLDLAGQGFLVLGEPAAGRLHRNTVISNRLHRWQYQRRL